MFSGLSSETLLYTISWDSWNSFYEKYNILRLVPELL